MPTRTISEAVSGVAVAPAPTVAARVGRPDQAAAAVAVTEATATVTATFETVSFPGDGWGWPGPWAPDAGSLVAFVPREPGAGPDEAAIVRVWAVDTEAPGAIWDSGDVEDRIERTAGLAGWLGDGTLVLPRADDPLVAPDGRPLPSRESPAGQPRSIEVSPDGEHAFVNGPDGSWFLASDGSVRVVQGRPADGFDGWSWGEGGRIMVLSGADGGMYALDVVSGVAEAVARRPDARPSGGFAPPRWLADGTMLVTDALAVEADGVPAFDHRIVDPEGERSASVPRLLGLPANEEMPLDASPWVEPGGSRLLYPEVRRLASGDLAARWWLLDVASRQRREAPVMTEPRWDPSGRRVVFRDGDGQLAVWVPDTDAVRELRLGGARAVAHAWSSSGRWLAMVDERGGLWLAATDVAAGPTLVAETVDATVLPTFAPDDSALAVTVVDDEGGRRLVVAEIGIDRP